MNFKTNKDIIIRIVKDFLGVTAVGAMFMLICLMLFAESIILSKEVIGFLIGIAILCLGIGGLASAIFIFFHCCLKEIAKLKKTIAKQDQIISNQYNEEQTFNFRHIPSSKPASNEAEKNTGKNIIEEISDLSEDIDDDETVELEASELEVRDVSDEANVLTEDFSEEKDV